MKFQSTPPAQGATRGTVGHWFTSCCFNPRPPRRGRHEIALEVAAVTFVSIHAPRAGGDLQPFGDRIGEGAFQSTPPAQGATRSPSSGSPRDEVSIHAPRAGGDKALLARQSIPVVSIHAPRAGGDVQCESFGAFPKSFNPRPPAQGATLFLFRTGLQTRSFNPRPPRRGRRGKIRERN